MQAAWWPMACHHPTLTSSDLSSSRTELNTVGVASFQESPSTTDSCKCMSTKTKQQGLEMLHRPPLDG